MTARILKPPAALRRFLLFRASLPALALAAIAVSVSPSEETMQWRALIERGRAHISQCQEVLKSDARMLPALYPNMEQRLLELDLRLHRLITIYNARWKSPITLIDMEGQLHAIRSRAGEIIAPLKKEEKRLSSVVKFLFCIARTRMGPRTAGEQLLPPEIISERDALRRDAEALHDRAASLESQLAGRIAEADDFRDGVDAYRKSINAELGGVLRAFYLSRSAHLFSPDGWREGGGQLAWWALNFRAANLVFSQYDNTIWRSVILHALAAGAILAAAALIALRRIEARAGSPGLARRLMPTAAWGAAGAAVFIGSQMPDFVRTAFIVMLGWLFLSRALISLGEHLRPAGAPEAARRRWLVTPLWLSVAAGNLLQGLDVHTESLAMLWAAATVLCFAYACRCRTEPESREGAARRALLALLAALILCALSGWANIAIFASTIVMLISVSATLAAGVSAAHPRISPVIALPRGGDLAPKLMRDVLTSQNVFILAFFSGSAAYVFYLGDGALLHKALALHLAWRSVRFHVVTVPLIVAGYFFTRSAIAVAHDLIPACRRGDAPPDEGAVVSLQALSAYSFWFLYGMTSLSLIGFTMANLALVAGGLSVGIGFGMQHIINNFISGVILLLGREIQPGDMIERDGAFCQVEKVTIRNTILRTYAGKSVIVPNSEFITKGFANWTYRDPRVRMEIPVRVAAAADSRLVQELLLKAARSDPCVLASPAPSVRFDNFGQGRLEFSLRVWVGHPRDRKVVSELRHEIDRLFREKGIAMA